MVLASGFAVTDMEIAKIAANFLSQYNRWHDGLYYYSDSYLFWQRLC